MQRVQAFVCCLAFLLLFSCCTAFASELAELTGYVSDRTGARVPRCRVQVTNVETNVSYFSETNEIGLYRISAIPVGNYRVIVQKTGFKTIVKQGIELHVQDIVSLNFQLEIGAVAESVTVESGAPLIDTESATVSTVVDRNFAENLPMNGRSFQTLIQLTPGVVLTTTNGFDAGQFSVSGQRAASNYWMVDGVSANIGTSSVFQGDGVGGALGSFSAFGGTNSLVSVDALQEFRIQTSTYAPEFGRTPGGQISIVTRSGTNQFHGTAFDYLRNDVLDANDWFANSAGLPKPKERQNDFGGTFSGPILKDRTFFFLSYEGLRLRLPQVALTAVPDTAARQNATSAMQPFLNAFPLPNGTDNVATGVAQFNASFSNKATLDAYSIRIDHKLSSKVSLFGRYNYSPSELDQRGFLGTAANSVTPFQIDTQTATVGASWLVSPQAINDLRFNYSKVNASSSSFIDRFGAAAPVSSLGFPSSFTSANSSLFIDVFSLTNGSYLIGKNITNQQKQFNIVGSTSIQRESHSLKFGVDFRRLSPVFAPQVYSQSAFFNDVPSFERGNLLFRSVQSGAGATFLFRNLGIFAQDTWRPARRWTITYGVRWDVDFAPLIIDGPKFPAVTGFNINDLSRLALAPSGTAAFNTPYGNVAPRLGLAYQLSPSQDWATVFRGGFGVFFDLATQQLGNLIGQSAYPFGASSFNLGGTFPLSPANATPPPITPPGSGSGKLLGFDPNLKLPYTLEWNVSLEQGLGRQQILSTSYIGSVGRRLIQSAFVNSPNQNYASAILVANTATSDYHALQIQFQRRLSRGLQALASFNWAHSIDDASAGSIGDRSNEVVPGLSPTLDRGSSDFDIRYGFSAGVTYDIPSPRINAFANAILRGWSLENVIQARSAPPVNIFYSNFLTLSGFGGQTRVRPDVVSGQPFYLFGSQYAGGWALNPAAFTPPPKDASGKPVRQGSLGRNALRAFGATQWDFAVHRDLPIRESLKLQFRAEMFNVLNHPNFGPPRNAINVAGFGKAFQMLGQALSGGTVGGGGFSPLYQIGGPRSIQFALKLTF